MLDDLRKKGKPVTPKLEEMALWLDGLDTSTLDDGQVSSPLPSSLPLLLSCSPVSVRVFSCLPGFSLFCLLLLPFSLSLLVGSLDDGQV